MTAPVVLYHAILGPWSAAESRAYRLALYLATDTARRDLVRLDASTDEGKLRARVLADAMEDFVSTAIAHKLAEDDAETKHTRRLQREHAQFVAEQEIEQAIQRGLDLYHEEAAHVAARRPRV